MTTTRSEALEALADTIARGVFADEDVAIVVFRATPLLDDATRLLLVDLVAARRADAEVL